MRSEPLTAEEEIYAYRAMLLVRRFEEKAGQLYGMGQIGGFCHLYIGQEAVVTGLHMAASGHDQVIATYRDHGHMLACGMDPKGVMAELTGRRGGLSKGKGFQGVMRRHNFSGQGAAHGNHKKHRAPGSIGACATPSRVFKGMRMAGRMGGDQVTTLNLLIVGVDTESAPRRRARSA